MTRPSAIYLDHHATTPVDERVLSAMWPYFAEKFGNAASVGHAFGEEAAAAVERARAQIAGVLHASPRSIVFTSGATESDNLAIKGVLFASPPKSHVITTAAEHRAVLDPLRRCARLGFDLTILPVDDTGRVSAEQVADAIRPETVLVSAIWANNEVGSLNPVAEIGAACRARGVLFHTDASQAVGKLEIDLAQLPIDLLTATAHKLYGPKGIGLLYVRDDGPRIPLEPLIHGGGHERRLRSGTLPVPLIVGFGEACAIAGAVMAAENVRLGELRGLLLDGLRTRIDDLVVNGHAAERLPGNLNVSIPGVDGEALLANLEGLAVSSGSACTSADPEPSHVLRAMGRSEALTRSSLRFGLGRGTTREEIDAAIEIVCSAALRLRGGPAPRQT